MMTSSPSSRVASSALNRIWLAASAHGDLRRLVIQGVLAAEFLRYGLLQFRDAVGRGVAGLACVDRRLGRISDVLGRVEVRLARAEADHVAPRRLQLPRLRRDRDGRGGLDPSEL